MFELGDRVVLRGTSEVMHVCDVDGDRVECRLIDKHGVPHFHWYKAAALVHDGQRPPSRAVSLTYRRR